MVTLRQKSLLALMVSGALFSSANSFGINTDSFDWPTTRYYTSAFLAGAAGGAVARQDILLNIFLPAICHWGYDLGSNATEEQRANARFVRGAGSALSTGAIYCWKVPIDRRAKVVLILAAGASASILPSSAAGLLPSW